MESEEKNRFLKEKKKQRLPMLIIGGKDLKLYTFQECPAGKECESEITASVSRPACREERSIAQR
ncbi:MAG: hypothetical protein RDV48_23855 [Candidatus Eremiobacteraeota bacterium]|nr:hypothetical protein [Candidatus Eremiobacteraeota bacterium]